MIRPSRLLVALVAATVFAALGAPSASAATASKGCGKPLAAGDRTIPLTVNGYARPFLLYVPQGYSPTTPRPLVLNLHGTGGSGAGQMDTSELRSHADAGRFLVAAPSGGGISGTGFTWVVPGVPPRGDPPPGGFPDDLAYLSKVITKVQAIACQDPARVIATGYSGGGRMTSAVACGLADRVAAIVANAGLRAGAPNAAGTAPDPRTCAPARPLPVFAVHGTNDGTNPYDGGGTADWQYSVPQALSRWAKLFGCDPTAVVTPFASLTDIVEHRNCRRSGVVRLYRVEGGGHVWFGRESNNPAQDPMQIKTSDVVGDVVRDYRLRSPVIRLFSARCVSGGVRVRAAAVFDSPIRSLTIRIDGRRVRVQTGRTLDRRFTAGNGPHRIAIRAVDRAGLTKGRALRRVCSG